MQVTDRIQQNFAHFSTECRSLYGTLFKQHQNALSATKKMRSSKELYTVESRKFHKRLTRMRVLLTVEQLELMQTSQQVYLTQRKFLITKVTSNNIQQSMRCFYLWWLMRRATLIYSPRIYNNAMMSSYNNAVWDQVFSE